MLTGHNRPKYSKQEIAFRGLMTCAHDGCMLTGDIQKQKYVYYRCTGNRGKCDLPRFKEEALSQRLGEPLKNLRVPPAIVAMLREDQNQAENRQEKEKARLESRLTFIRNRMDSAYMDKLDGKVPDDSWERKMTKWRAEEQQQLKLALDGLASSQSTDMALGAQRVFELANKAYLLDLLQDSTEKAKLLRMMCSNLSVDAASVTPTYRSPFDMIFKNTKMEEWSGREDSNLRPRCMVHQNGASTTNESLERGAFLRWIIETVG